MKHRSQRGLGALTILMVLVLMVALAAAMLRMGVQSHGQITQDLQGTRATLVARAGLDWGLYQAFKGSWVACANASQTLDMSADGGNLRVTVRCNSRVFNEGETSPGVARTVRVYSLDAVACASSTATTACPDSAAAVRPGYVERRMQVQATD